MRLKFIMTNLPGSIQLQVTQFYSLRTWIEYGFKQVKNELGWTDFRLTDYTSIGRWWEVVFSAYLLVCGRFRLTTSKLLLAIPMKLINANLLNLNIYVIEFSQHPVWSLVMLGRVLSTI